MNDKQTKPEERRVENPNGQWRQIVIETDGEKIRVVKSDVSPIEMGTIFKLLFNEFKVERVLTKKEV